MAITLYANWNGEALVTAPTIAAALAALTSADCLPGTVIGDGLTDMTALDTGDCDVFRDRARHRLDLLTWARRRFPRADT